MVFRSSWSRPTQPVGLRIGWARYLRLGALVLFWVAAGSAQGGSFGLRDVGGSFGFEAENGISFRSYEVSGTLGTPWFWTVGDRSRFQFDLEFGLGALHGESTTGGFVRVAPLLEFGTDGFPLSVFATTGPVLITEDRYDAFDLGGHIHFASAAGLKWRLGSRWSLAYRIQHISNAGLASPNPGLDMHVLRLAHVF